jgi:hypothetical protein
MQMLNPAIPCVCSTRCRWRQASHPFMLAATEGQMIYIVMNAFAIVVATVFGLAFGAAYHQATRGTRPRTTVSLGTIATIFLAQLWLCPAQGQRLDDDAGQRLHHLDRLRRPHGDSLLSLPRDHNAHRACRLRTVAGDHVGSGCHIAADRVGSADVMAAGGALWAVEALRRSGRSKNSGDLNRAHGDRSDRVPPETIAPALSN